MQGTQAKRNAKGPPFRFFLGVFEVVVGFEVEGAAREVVVGEAVEVEGLGVEVVAGEEGEVVAGSCFDPTVSLEAAVVGAVELVFSSSFGTGDAAAGTIDVALPFVVGGIRLGSVSFDSSNRVS